MSILMGHFKPQHLSCFFKPVDIERFKKEVKNIGAVEEHPFLTGYYFLNITNKDWLNGEQIFALCNNLYEAKLAEVIEPVFVKQIKVENPLRPWQWNIRNNANIPGGVIGADMAVENAWNLGAIGTGIRVAVIDDGVDLTHPDLVNNLLPGFDATGNNSGGAPANNNGHGTNCAGIIAATNNTDGVIGVAFDAQIIPIRMGIVVGGFFVNVTETMKATCFNEAVNRGADVISCSWGGGSVSAQLNVAIENAVNNGRGGIGCVVLFAAGNDNTAISATASNPIVIAVGASSTCDTRKRSSNNPALVNPGVSTDPEGVSCDGEGWWGSNFGTGLDVLAPGVWISTTDNAGANGFVAGNFNDHFNGTSAACPNVAAVAALILSANPNLTGVQVRNILEQSCFKIPNGNFQANVSGQPNGTWSNQAGYGRVNACRAVLEAYQTGNLVNGDVLVCTNNTYSLQNVPNADRITWSSSNPIGLNINPTSGTATRMNNFNGQITITATINSGCGVANVTRNIWVGLPNFTIQSPYSYEVCAEAPFGIGYSPTTSNQQITGQYWTATNCELLSYPSDPISNVKAPCPGEFFTVVVEVSNVCGSRTSGRSFYSVSEINGVPCMIEGSCGGYFMMSVTPNPTTNEFVIEVIDNNTVAKSSEPLNIKLISDAGEVLRTATSNSDKLILDTSGLKDGFYYLHIEKGDKLEKRRVMIKR